MPRSARQSIQRSIHRIRDGFQHSSPSYALNTLLNLPERALQRQRIRSYPRILQIDVTNRCNLNCIFCSRHSHSLKLGDMPEDLFQELERISERALETNLTGYGEPLVSQAFFALLPRIRSARISFITNGLALTGEVLKRVLSLADRPLYSIAFSIDGSRPETYDRIRKGSDFETVWQNLENTSRTGRRSSPAFETWINFVAMRNNVRELPSLIERAAAAGVSRIIVFHLVVWAERYRDESLLRERELCRDVFQEAREAAIRHNVLVDLPAAFPVAGEKRRSARVSGKDEPRCSMPWSYAYIRHDGSVHACCFSESFSMGNLYRNSFEEIWNSRSYRNLRKIVNDRLPRDCRRCELRYRYQPSPNDEKTYIKLKPRTM